MDDLRRLYYVAEHYQQLQGLRLLPLALPFLLPGPLDWARTMLGLSPGAGVLLFLTAAAAAAFGIGRYYYAPRFGRVEPHRWRTGAATLILSTAAFLWLTWLQETRPLPVSLPLLFLSVMLARLGCCAGRLRSHYLWIAGAFAVAAFGRLLHLPHAVATPLSDLLIGGGIVVAGLGDHRVLRRALTIHPREGGLS